MVLLILVFRASFAEKPNMMLMNLAKLNLLEKAESHVKANLRSASFQLVVLAFRCIELSTGVQDLFDLHLKVMML